MKQISNQGIKFLLIVTILTLGLIDVLLITDIKKKTAEAQTCVDIVPTCRIRNFANTPGATPATTDNTIGGTVSCQGAEVLTGAACYGDSGAIENFNLGSNSITCGGDGYHYPIAICCSW